jgi:hypothetical protein
MKVLVVGAPKRVRFLHPGVVGCDCDAPVGLRGGGEL